MVRQAELVVQPSRAQLMRSLLRARSLERLDQSWLDFALLVVNAEWLTLHLVPLAPGRYELASSFDLDLQWELRQRAQDDARLLVVHDVNDAIFLALHLQLKALQCGAETYFRHG